jgi:hypothetical protein
MQSYRSGVIDHDLIINAIVAGPARQPPWRSMTSTQPGGYALALWPKWTNRKLSTSWTWHLKHRERVPVRQA